MVAGAVAVTGLVAVAATSLPKTKSAACDGSDVSVRFRTWDDSGSGDGVECGCQVLASGEVGEVVGEGVEGSWVGG